ncbi:hypothetical protein ACI65C_001970 [Semiaphis heraclei]
MSKESKNNILKYFSSTASTSPQAIKKLKLDDNVIQNNEISLPSTSSQIPASDLLDNTKNVVSTFEARKDISYYIGKQLKFQTALAILVKIFSISFPLSRYLQTVNLDLKTALEAASNVQNTIQEIRENCDVEFQQLFLSVITLCEKFDITVSLPRQCKSDNPEYFLRVSVFIPFIDNFLDQLNDRFISHRIVLNNFDCILPKIEMKISEEIKGNFKQLVETYQDIVDECTDSNLNDNLLNGGLDLWYTKYSTLTSAELKNKNAIERNGQPRSAQCRGTPQSGSRRLGGVRRDATRYSLVVRGLV